MLSARTVMVLVFCISAYANKSPSANSPQKTLHRNGFKILDTFENLPLEDDQIKIEKVRKRKSVNEIKLPKPGLRATFDEDKIESTTIKYTKSLNKQVAAASTDSLTELNPVNYKRESKQRRRQRLPQKEKLVEKNNSTITVSHNVTKQDNIKSKSQVVTKEPQTFPKRPAEFNPVFKKRVGGKDPVVKIIQERNNVYSHTGNFYYSYEGGDGTMVSSQGELRSFKDKTSGEVVSGSVFYKDNEGKDVSLTYTADENGYQPVGAHLPTPPPIPPQIARALAYLATKTTPQPVTEAYVTEL